MQQSLSDSHFVWHGDPVMFRSGVLDLPFEISIFGLLLAAALIWFGYQKLDEKFNPQPDKRRARRRDKQEPQKSLIPGTHVAGLWIGALLLGQLIFAVIPSPGIGQIGPIEMRWYGFGFALAFILGYFLGSTMFRHAGFKQEDADALLMYLFVGTIAGARLGEVLFYNPAYYFSNPAEILMVWKGGLASHGAFIGNILAMWLYVSRRSHITYVWVLDRMTIPFAIGGVFVRMGNFFNSEIYGLPTDVPWAVIFERVDMLPRHPSMLYEAGVGLVLFVILWGMYKYWKHTPPAGALLGVFLTVLFAARFLVEITKVEQADFAVEWIVGMGQLLSIPLVIAGLYILIARVNWKEGAGNSPA